MGGSARWCVIHHVAPSVPLSHIVPELDDAVRTFREILRQSWTRRAIRLITTATPAELLPSTTLSDITALRDPAWVTREAAYHDTAVEQLNALVRKYNGLAPYAVRRPYYTRVGEIEKLYDSCAEDILAALKERAKESGIDINSLHVARGGAGKSGGEARSGVSSSDELAGVQGGAASWGVRDMIRSWLDKIAARWRG